MGLRAMVSSFYVQMSACWHHSTNLLCDIFSARLFYFAKRLHSNIPLDALGPPRPRYHIDHSNCEAEKLCLQADACALVSILADPHRSVKMPPSQIVYMQFHRNPQSHIEIH
jgi:hypothetical protein